MGEDARPDPRENVTSFARNHLDPTAQPILPPGRLALSTLQRAEEEECLGFDGHGRLLGGLGRHQHEPVDKLGVRGGKFDSAPPALAEADHSRRTPIPHERQLDVALRSLVRIRIEQRPAGGQAQNDARSDGRRSYERGRVLSGS